jgi:hypothetical protein
MSEPLGSFWGKAASFAFLDASAALSIPAFAVFPALSTFCSSASSALSIFF